MANSTFFPSPITLDESCVWTVAYSDQFDFSLTAHEIFARGIRVDGETRAPTFEKVQGLLERLVRQKKLEKEGNFFFLPGRVSVVRARTARSLRAAKIEQSLSPLLFAVRRIPWIESVWITGSLAVRNTTSNQDVDFMVITQPDRLWISRLFLTFFVWCMGKKRLPYGKESGTWCFNLWLDAEHCGMPTHRQNLYTAYEIVQARPFFARAGAIEHFWKANAWVKQVVWNWQPKSSLQVTNKSVEKQLRWRGVLDVFEWIFYHFQALYMRRHRTTEEVAAGCAFFHPRQTSQIVARRWREQISYEQSMLHLRALRARHKRIIFATGVFDVLHRMHEQFLRDAKALGGYLVVGIEADGRVRQMKGAERPYFPQEVRQHNLQALNIADEVIALPENFGEPAVRTAYISMLRPDFFAASSHSSHLEKKKKIIEQYGGVLRVVTQHDPHFSSTLRIRELRNQQKGE